MKTGDIVMIFGNPIKLEHPIGKAKLISLLSSHPENLEFWEIEYLNDPNHHYQALIKKEEIRHCNINLKCSMCKLDIDEDPMIKPKITCEKYHVSLKLDSDEMSIIAYSECKGKE